jgi:nitrate/nitrite transporter NarK
MTFKPTILNLTTGLFVIGIFLYTVFNYGQLSEGEGWGIVAMFGLLGVAVVLLLIDFILQQIFRNRKTVNIIGVLITILAAYLLLFK